MASTLSSCRAPCSSLAQRSCRTLGRPFCPVTAPLRPSKHLSGLAPVEPPSCRLAHVCKAFNNDQDKQGGSTSVSGSKLEFNKAYAAITLVFIALLAFRNPYIYAVLSIITILPQNSNVTSLNNLVVLFYESGLFVNYAEAVTAVRLVTWLSIIMTLVSFALFN